MTVTHLHCTLLLDGNGDPVRDAYGNDILTATETPIAGAAVWPRATTETINDDDVVVAALSVLLPTGTVVAPTDQFRVGTLVYDVDGAAGDWTNPLTGWAAGVAVALKRVTG